MSELYAADQQVISKLQNLRFFPLALTGGNGCRVRDDAGRELLDFSAAWGSASLGHGHPAHVTAITAAAGNPAGASVLSAANEPAIRLARKLLEITPGQDDRRVWIGHSGSDANEAAARAVRAATGRSGMVAFSGAYHGGIAGSMAISGHSAQEGVEKDKGLVLIPYPDPYRPYESDPSGRAVLDELERRCQQDVNPDDIAAFIFEPIQADGGLIVPPPGFLQEVSAFCARHGILTICDEVKVGLGRSGLWHCFQHENIVPDIVTFGKGLGGGLPLSAVIGPAAVMNHASSFSMQTLHGNPICASAGLAVLDTIEKEKLADHAAQVGTYLQDRLKALAQRQALIGDVRGRGLVVGVELVRDRETKEPASREAAKAVYRCFELGLVVYYVGMQSNVLELTPPLVLSKAEVDEGVAIIEAALEDVAQGRVPDESLQGFEGW